MFMFLWELWINLIQNFFKAQDMPYCGYEKIQKVTKKFINILI